MRDLEALLLTVSSGAGMALVPQLVAERYGAPGLRFVPLAGDQPAITTAVVTRQRTMHTPTLAFLRSVSRPSTAHVDPRPAISIVPAHPVRQRVTEGNRA
jgi:DNA-binding transcriptional LysR family regulator